LGSARFVDTHSGVLLIGPPGVGKSHVATAIAGLTEQRYAAKNVLHRVPVIRHFGEFARPQGAHSITDLPAHVDDFVGKRPTNDVLNGRQPMA
jgi:energy-coupling factor transporter ATP-binding protein EcfA2